METLIRIWQTKEGRAVSARELHEALGVGKFFANWIKDRITEYEFVENVDYQIIKGDSELLLDSAKIKNKVGRP